ncbi:hypothetical protein [Brevundimonas aveniformis]|uniref:hypothetical protein n=1 Tax=Brevundimonas aveniformis TaxID=370977 RepID=UPI0024920D2A|nr:hypothetical protein [Brevundimonas aveniformis]
MRKNSTMVAGVAILSAFALAACGLGGGGDNESGSTTSGSSRTANNSSAGSGGDSGGGATTVGNGAKPSDEGAGGGSSGGDSTTTNNGGNGSGGGQSPGSGGGSNMQEVGNVIEGFADQLSGYLDHYQQEMAPNARRAGQRDVITGLQAGGEYRWNLGTLRRGQTYVILGACDQDCTDVDLFLEDGSGTQIGEDTATDDYPIITVTPGRDGPFTARIALVNCSVEPCYVAGRLLQQ